MLYSFDGILYMTIHGKKKNNGHQLFDKRIGILMYSLFKRVHSILSFNDIQGHKGKQRTFIDI